MYIVDMSLEDFGKVVLCFLVLELMIIATLGYIIDKLGYIIGELKRKKS